MAQASRLLTFRSPGEILLEEYLQPMGISQNAMARSIGVTPRTISIDGWMLSWSKPPHKGRVNPARLTVI